MQPKFSFGEVALPEHGPVKGRRVLYLRFQSIGGYFLPIYFDPLSGRGLTRIYLDKLRRPRYTPSALST